MCLFSTGDSVPGIFKDEGIWKRGDEVEARVFDNKKPTGKFAKGFVTAVRISGDSKKYDITYESGDTVGRVAAKYIRNVQEDLSSSVHLDPSHSALTNLLTRLKRSIRRDIPFVPGHCFYTAAGAGLSKSARDMRLIVATIMESDPVFSKYLAPEHVNGIDVEALIRIYPTAWDRYFRHYPDSTKSIEDYTQNRIEMHRRIDCNAPTEDTWYWNTDMEFIALTIKHGALLILDDDLVQVLFPYVFNSSIFWSHVFHSSIFP